MIILPLHKLLTDIHRLEVELGHFEGKFGVKSQDFYAAMLRGDLTEFDAWLALYKTWLSLDEKYRQLISRQPIAIQIKSNLEPAYA